MDETNLYIFQYDQSYSKYHLVLKPKRTLHCPKWHWKTSCRVAKGNSSMAKLRAPVHLRLICMGSVNPIRDSRAFRHERTTLGSAGCLTGPVDVGDAQRPMVFNHPSSKKTKNRRMPRSRYEQSFTLAPKTRFPQPEQAIVIVFFESSQFREYPDRITFFALEEPLV